MDRAFWNDEFERDPDGVMVADRILDAELAGLSPGTALDLGCGSGQNALKLAVRCWSVLGVDWAPRAIELANASATSRGLDARFVVGDITSWQPPGAFDLVISTYALPGGEDSRRVLRTAAAAVAEGGTLLVAEWDRSMAEVWGFGDDDLMTPWEIAELLAPLAIEKAEVRRFRGMFVAADDPRGHRGTDANVAVVRAKRPRGSSRSSEPKPNAT
jgi:SAM-dependent methyltransferase